MAKSKRRATYKDLEALPDNVVGEIIDGELIATPRPASLHARASSGLGFELGSFDGPLGGGGQPGGWWILDEPELHLGQDVIVPDLAGWRRERMPTFPNVAAFELPPDWVCEVLSPSTTRIDRGPKMTIYGRAGVGHLWFIDPPARSLEIFRLTGANYLHLQTLLDDARFRGEPFDAVELSLGRLWPDA